MWLYIICTVLGTTSLYRYFGYQQNSVLECYKPEHIEDFMSMTVGWLLIEIVIFWAFLGTMVLLLIKSLFGHGISADNSKMFGGTYLTLLADQLCRTLVEKCESDKVGFPKGIYSER